MQQDTCPPVCWSTSCNIWHPSKDLGSYYCDTCPPMEQLSSTHQQWFHILPYAETPPWMQCQSSQHCPKWHHCHTAGSVKTPLHSRTTCITPICTTHAAHIYCTCNTGNPDKTGSSCSCHASSPTECPGTNAYNIPCHTCAATKIWPCPHGTKTPDPGDLGTVTQTVHGLCSHNVPPHTSPTNHCNNLPYHNLREGDTGVSYDCV